MRVAGTLRAARDALRAARNPLHDESGVSAIEFGLVAPLIFFSLLAMTDVGFALRERIALDHLLRSGAQAAMRDAGEAAVLQTLEQSACTADGTYPECAKPAGVTFVPAPDRFCVCPTTGAIDTDCTSTCAEQPQKFYLLSAALTYNGIFLPLFEFAPSVLVEVR